MYRIIGERVELLDPSPTHGMCSSPDGTRLARVCHLHYSTYSSVIISDRSGVLHYRRHDKLGDPHTLTWTEDGIFVTASNSNSVFRLDERGEVVERWSPRGVRTDADCWHVNGVEFAEGRMFVSAFGQFTEPQGWRGPQARGAGVVVDALTGEVVVGGLTAPHNPTWMGDGWLVCDSANGDVLRTDRTGRIVVRQHLGGWTRAVASCGDRLYVGSSAVPDRAFMAEGAGTAAAGPGGLHELAGDTLQPLRSWAMPMPDLNVLLVCDDDLAIGLRVGTGLPGNRFAAEEAMTAPLDLAECRADLELIGVEDDTVWLRVTNRSGTVWSSLGPHPVRIGARSRRDDSEPWTDLARSSLPGVLAPGQTVIVGVTVAPAEAPETLRIAALQENVCWFDVVDPTAVIDLPRG